MAASSRYGSMWCISPASETLGYKKQLIPSAQEFFQTHIASSQGGAVQSALLSYFYAQRSAVTPGIQAQAGFCLRCYVSDSILKACQTLDHLFGSDKSFTYRDLLPFVLNDDGRTPVILDRDRKVQLAVVGDAPPQTMTYHFFSIDVLGTFKMGTQPSLSLDNWTYLRTKQNTDLKKFLREFGLQHLSDWALLNRARPHQLKQLSERDRRLIEVFHDVYRRDRRQQLAGSRRCPNPSTIQLQEMMTRLRTKNLTIAAGELTSALKQLAAQLRQCDVWASRVPLEVPDPDTGIEAIRTDLPSHHIDAARMEQQEWLTFFHQQLQLALNDAIVQGLKNRIVALERSKKYMSLAPQLIPGLQLYYEQGLSLKEIAPVLGMSSRDQARRVLNPGDLLNQVRAQTVQQVLDRMLARAQKQGFAQTPPEPSYLRLLAEQVEAIADQEIFQEAVEEMRAGQGRSFTSEYAQQLRAHLTTLIHREQIHG
ncbi:MAG: hypothetical protein QNJ46_30320 [Leptolyngbyaceae cyanobacterium MO_188.B28]|nr:hypothetical protein [Leptolyngbyaceae cyanobacterium MO_188.B28]